MIAGKRRHQMAGHLPGQPSGASAGSRGGDPLPRAKHLTEGPKQ